MSGDARAGDVTTDSTLFCVRCVRSERKQSRAASSATSSLAFTASLRTRVARLFYAVGRARAALVQRMRAAG